MGRMLTPAPGLGVAGEASGLNAGHEGGCIMPQKPWIPRKNHPCEGSKLWWAQQPHVQAPEEQQRLWDRRGVKWTCQPPSSISSRSSTGPNPAPVPGLSLAQIPPRRRLPRSHLRRQRCLKEQSNAGTVSDGLLQAQADEILQRGVQKKQHLLMAKPASPPRTLWRHFVFQPDLPTKVFNLFLQVNAQGNPKEEGEGSAPHLGNAASTPGTFTGEPLSIHF